MAAAMQQHHTATLGQLLTGLVPPGPHVSLEVVGIQLDSRLIRPGELFFACAGENGHGIAYIDQAIAQGAVAVLVEPDSRVGALPLDLLQRGREVPIIAVERLALRVGEIADRFYGHPSRQLKVVAITGTNGKTSVAQFVAQALSETTRCGVIGTLGSGLYGQLHPIAGRTTPDPVTLHAELAAMVAAGADYAVLEVSSHGIDQGRINGVAIDIALFTNLSHEHLDYHGTLQEYAAVKQRLFQLPGLTHAVLNLDDPHGRAWITDLPPGCEAMGYSIDGHNSGQSARELMCDDLLLGDQGITFRIHSPFGSGLLESSLLGRFNASNLLAALGCLLALRLPFAEALDRLSRVTTVAGRMEAFGGGDRLPLVVVDYAHTPDALEHVLLALREHCNHHLWCLFGCGGDRDRAKRPLMGEIAGRLADHVVITNDNPRSEEPFAIIEEIMAGMANPDAAYMIFDRGEAIRHALHLAQAGDVVVVAGKGHETDQCIGDRCEPFSDREQVVARLHEEAGDA